MNHDVPKDPGMQQRDIPCCPQLTDCAVCDVLNFPYRLPFHPLIEANGARTTVAVDVTLHFRLTRCSGPMALGDVMYTTTLLPGEEVHLTSSDRHTRFSFDSETKLSYKNEATSEESYFAAGMAHGMSNLNLVDTTNASSSFHSSSVSGGGGAGIDLGIFSIGGSVSAGSYDAHSASTLARALSQHAETTQQHMEVSTRAASSTSIGEVSTRAHQQGESDDQFESSSRKFRNPNRCHAVSFYFYRINKCQTVKFELVRIERRVIDAQAPTSVALNPPKSVTGVAVRPTAVLATASNRLEVTRRALDSAALEQQADANRINPGLAARAFTTFSPASPMPVTVREAALRAVDEDLVKQGLIDKVGGEVSPEAQGRLGWSREMAMPTPGVLVKGCLDECDICEPELKQQMALDLVRMDLQNQLLQKQIELLEKSSEYRCCPKGEENTPAP
ncbi:hypothetical protein [Massilia sp. TWP1-3-3]|uniref:hypothetical protein n=1 Tax=Massilia sp. TWP1-3-3 TaxID=2804573 RepID=UPI003CE6A2B8